MAETRPLAFTGARLVDPAAGYDGPGCLMVADGVIAEVIRQPTHEGLSADIEVVACDGAMLAPGLVDLRVKTGEPGAETKETLKSAARAAVAGGVTSIVVQPDTDPVVDEPSVVDFILRRARDIGLVPVSYTHLDVYKRQDLGKASAALIGAMPGHELGLDLADLRLQPLIFLGLGGEQLLG